MGSPLTLTLSSEGRGDKGVIASASRAPSLEGEGRGEGATTTEWHCHEVIGRSPSAR
jgi:hypothetical protein